MAREKKTWKETLSPQEISNAIFVDFEGEQVKKSDGSTDYSDEKARKFLGILWNPFSSNSHLPRLQQFILDPTLKLCKNTFDAAEYGLCHKHNVKYFSTREKTEEEAIKFLLKERWNDAPIVSWSDHDKGVIQEMMNNDRFSDEQRSNIERRWRDAKATAKKWNREALSGKIKRPHKLSTYLSIVGYELPSLIKDDNGKKEKKISEEMKYLSDHLKNKRSIEELTEPQKTKWRYICEYNFHDLEGMRQVLLTAVSDS